MNDYDGGRYYSHALEAFNYLGGGGMSEDEDATEEIQVAGRVKKKKYKKVRILYRRNPLMDRIIKRIDNIPNADGDDDHIFDARLGGPRVERKRVGEINKRKLPLNLPASLYRPEYLQQLQPYQISALKLNPDTWQLLDLEHLVDPDYMDTT